MPGQKSIKMFVRSIVTRWRRNYLILVKLVVRPVLATTAGIDKAYGIGKLLELNGWSTKRRYSLVINYRKA